MSHQTDLEAAVQRLGESSRALITCHASPDGDALGSELAVAELARRLGTEPVIVNRDRSPANLRALPGAEQIIVSSELPGDFPADYDLVVTVECPGLDRAGLTGLDRLPILNLDHHRANPRYGEVNYVDEEAPALGEMVLRMFEQAACVPSDDAATNLFVAVATDTGDFRYDNATARAFRAAAALVEAGAYPPQVSEWVHEGRAAASVRLLGEALRNLEISCDGALAMIEVDPEAFRRASAGSADTEDIIDVPRSIDGVDVVAFLKQWEPGVVRVSLRSRGPIDVRRVAVSFGGGGHTNAAGCTVRGELDDVRRNVRERLVGLLGEAT
jgi:phosphoesterase RecJ-like protein